MVEILTVCTGNVCRSPLAEQLLRARLGPVSATVSSAGTRGLPSAPVTPETAELAASLGIDPDDTRRHRSRWLTDAMLRSPDLILAMTRDHRREIVELAPARQRATFTVREFARLSSEVPDDAIVNAAEAAGDDAPDRVRAVCALVASQRGLVLSSADSADDDVVDPYGRSRARYQRSAAQLEPAVNAVVRVLLLAVAGT